jgi:hypothetical protein
MSSVRPVRVGLTRYEPGSGIQVNNQAPIGHALWWVGADVPSSMPEATSFAHLTSCCTPCRLPRL